MKISILAISELKWTGMGDYNSISITVIQVYSPWDSPGKNTGVDCHAFLQGDLPDPGMKPVFLKSPALAAGFFATNGTWEAHLVINIVQLGEFT